MKSIVITGAFGGMGKATAEILSKRGYRIFALDLKSEELGENICPIKTDIRDEKSIKDAFAKVCAITDSVDAIIHFAGLYMLDSLVEIDEESFDKIFDVNLKGAYSVNKIFLPLLKKGAKIVITTSELATLDPLPFTGIYAVTKAALDKYAFALRMELQLRDISVSVLRAGAVETSMLGASCAALDAFSQNTKLYSCNAKRFKDIVERVEARSVSPVKIGEKMSKIVEKSKPKFAYSINRNPLLRLLNLLPTRIQLRIIRKILK